MTAANIPAKKPKKKAGKELKKVLGLKEIVFLSAGAIIGSGIFMIPAIAAGMVGYSSLFLWIVMGLVAIMMSMVFAELTSMYEDSGGVYTYVKRAFGDKLGFVVGWVAWVISWITIAMLVAAAVSYMSHIIPLSDTAKIIVSIFVVALFTFVNLKGIKHGARLQMILTGASFLILLSFVDLGWDFINFSTMVFEPLGWEYFLMAAAILIEPYIGWQDVTFLAEETKNPRKVIPKGIILGTLIVASLYFLVTLTALGSVHILPGGLSDFVAADAPLAFLAGSYVHGAGFFLSLGAVIIILGCLNSWITASPRLPYAMSKESMLPDFFADTNDAGVPRKALLFQFFVTSIIIFSNIITGGYELFLKVLIPVSLLLYFLVIASLLILRKKDPKRKRYFRLPFTYILTFLLAALIFILLMQTEVDVFVKGAVLVLLGIPFYFLIKFQADKRFTAGFFDRFSWFWDKFFPIWYGNEELKKVMNYAGVKQGQTVLDFGSGSGLSTIAISKRVGPRGIVVATDISKSQLKKVKEKVEKKNITNAVLIKETELSPFEPETFDAFVSVSVLEHFVNPRRIIERLMTLLKKGGGFCFLSFGYSFGIPPPHFLKNRHAIHMLFKDLGYDVRVEGYKKYFTQCWFIYGKKK
ncbi:MAG: hypothetical protein B6U68_03455 [Candidatus Aenigmarchaeota archaeon ex4484_14]|nr:MAG: hypothetical protein B6U68_03455 [Candidatus Aenigmarchaeota archaeon ex4484_14]